MARACVPSEARAQQATDAACTITTVSHTYPVTILRRTAHALCAGFAHSRLRSPRRTVAVSLWFTALRAVSVLASVSVSVDMSGKVEEDAGAGETAVMPTLFLSHGGGTCAWC